MRNYFSAQLLFAAIGAAARAQAIEDGFTESRAKFDLQHRAAVLTAVTSSVGFLEATVNELFQDAADGHHRHADAYIRPLGEAAIERMALVWDATKGRGRLMDKFNWVLKATDHPEIDRRSRIYQDVDVLVELRNRIAHYRPEDVAADQPNRLDRLQGRFAENRLMAGSGNPWWPDHCLGAGCAQWAHQTAQQLADQVSATLGIAPNYHRIREGGWMRQPPNQDGT